MSQMQSLGFLQNQNPAMLQMLQQRQAQAAQQQARLPGRQEDYMRTHTWTPQDEARQRMAQQNMGRMPQQNIGQMLGQQQQMNPNMLRQRLQALSTQPGQYGTPSPQQLLQQRLMQSNMMTQGPQSLQGRGNPMYDMARQQSLMARQSQSMNGPVMPGPTNQNMFIQGGRRWR